MTVLLLRLAGPLQSWGTSSRFVRRNTDRAPSKSGVIGLLAAAKGLRRTDPLEDLAHLRVGVRLDQPGRVERDFQTARTRDGSTSMPLSYRFYLADAVFLAAVEGDRALLEGLAEALRRPVYPLYLGRRSCPPAGPLLLGLRDGDIETALNTEPWRASPWVQRSHRSDRITLDALLDCPLDVDNGYLVRDEPLTFDPRHRDYTWRRVQDKRIEVANPLHNGNRPATSSPDPHDPMAALEGAL
ncbi:type I-E CRISPR-associated protein Cas5/CasD [Amycolatopsis cynarae]|uniref:Type I-E CRISPR-associated protein Cas5/CasD n=1 Tax=Amycolatopsis cynarae TaxID=2995223 RepID=A0ABY7B0Y9_9PSEU|nr:type I-E CRISPR-associated protein Cas5/CasD [Amycolatopsis sp. HUAS 11-8]WAL65966.1 type I-E CRISPR-associated protein Cas5/CasD [Amycolatopsis sp. HUAS 11-8]